jgi:hypothetical protein
LLVFTLNAASERGLTPAHDEWPMERLEFWGSGAPGAVCDSANGVDASAPGLGIIGQVWLRLVFVGVDGRQVRKTICFQIFKGDCCRWRGLILGGRDLDPAPVGMGLRTTPTAHVLDEFGLQLQRLEQDTVNKVMHREYHALLALVAPSGGQVWSSGTPKAIAGEPRMVGLVDWGEESGDVDPTTGSTPQCGAEAGDGPLGPALWLPVTLDAEDLYLAPGTGALAPAMLTWPDGRAASHSGVMIGTNDLAAVRCLNGTWGAGETAGMVMVVNTGVADAVLERGDLVAAARVDLQEPPPAPDEAGRRPDVAHIILQEDDLDRLFEVEMPSEDYYQGRAAARRQDYPSADVHLLEHLDAIEPLLGFGHSVGLLVWRCES